ncbi:MAG: DMT family transporter [Acidobacteria bacterium]|nr:DMT family transporter [Acidobacteriota bacterium]
MTLRSSAAFQAIVAGILFSTGGAAVKATQLDAWQVAGTRSLIAAAVLLVAIPAARRWAGGVSRASRVPAAIGWWRSPQRRRAFLLTLGTGCCYCLTLLLFVHAAKRTTAAETIFLQSTAPLFVLLLSPLLLRERPDGRQLLFVPLFGAGLVMAFFGGADAAATAPDPRTGNVLATFCGLAYGLTLIGLRAAGRSPPAGRAAGASGGTSSAGDGAAARAPGIAAAACGNVIVCLACLPVMAPLNSAAPGELLIVVYLGLFQVALAYVFVTRAARVLQAPVVALLLLLEPALTPFWAMWFHGEQPHLLTWLGGGVVALATVLLAAVVRSAEE